MTRVHHSFILFCDLWLIIPFFRSRPLERSFDARLTRQERCTLDAWREV